jgi:hypothetical protein
MKTLTYYWVLVGIFLVATVASIILGEHLCGQLLKKKWYKWFALILFFSSVVWLPLLIDIADMNVIVMVIFTIIIIIIGTLVPYFYQWALNYRPQKSIEKGFFRDVPGEVHRFPSSQWWVEMCITGLFAACVSLVLGQVISISIMTGDIGTWIFFRSYGIGILCAIWTVLPLLTVFLTSFRWRHRQVLSYGVASGVFAAIAFAITMEVPNWYLSGLMFACPLIGGLLGEKLFFLLKQKQGGRKGGIAL